MTLLDRFNVLEFLGEGAWGQVYLMHDALFSQALAVKVVEVTDADEGAVGRVLLHEARAADRIQDHRHVVKRFGTHHVELDERDLLLLPMEYADGGDLRTWLTQHRDAPGRRREKGFEYFVQLCHGVAAVNEAGFVCGDIKPENVLLVGGVVKLGDLGTAITLDESVGEAVSSLPIPIESIGTPAYMSPEMFTAAHWSEIDARSDVYSLGVILYEILHPVGERPFDGDWDSLRELHVNGPPPSLPGVEPALSEIVVRCLAKSPEERFETSRDLLAALEDFTPQVAEPQQGQAGSEDWEVLDTLWAYTSEAIEQREFNEARNMCRQILSSFPEHVSTRLALEELDDRFQRAEYMYRDIYQHMGVRNLAESVALPLRRWRCMRTTQLAAWYSRNWKPGSSSTRNWSRRATVRSKAAASDMGCNAFARR